VCMCLCVCVCVGVCVCVCVHADVVRLHKHLVLITQEQHRALPLQHARDGKTRNIRYVAQVANIAFAVAQRNAT